MRKISLSELKIWLTSDKNKRHFTKDLRIFVSVSRRVRDKNKKHGAASGAKERVDDLNLIRCHTIEVVMLGN